jgi:hypothetical protein
MSYRPVLTGRALAQFNDFIKGRENAYEAFMRHLLWLIDAPWDAWPVYPGGDEPEFRETQFGEHGPDLLPRRRRRRTPGDLQRPLGRLTQPSARAHAYQG